MNDRPTISWVILLLLSVIITIAKCQECPSGYTYYSSSASCYKYYSTEFNYADATQSCNDNSNGWLVTISDSNENDIIYSLCGTTMCYIGYNDIASEGNFIWQHGTSSYTNWRYGEPNNDDEEDCVNMWEGGWNDSGCWRSRAYVCEVDPINSTETVLCSQCSNSNHYYVKIHIDSSELIGLNLQEVDLYSEGNLIAGSELTFSLSSTYYAGGEPLSAEKCNNDIIGEDVLYLCATEGELHPWLLIDANDLEFDKIVVANRIDGGPSSSTNLAKVSVFYGDSTLLYTANFSDQGTSLSTYIFDVQVETAIISTIAGTGTDGYGGDEGAASDATFSNLAGITLDAAGNLFICDQWNHRIRKVELSTGIINTVYGTGTAGFSGDGGIAENAEFFRPNTFLIDSSENKYICDQYNQRIRKVSASTGIITTIVGTGIATYDGDGIAATSASLNQPVLTLDSLGNLYIADTDNDRIRKVTVSTGIIITVAGTGSRSYNGDGVAATSAHLNYPVSVIVDSDDNLYISDVGNYRIRMVTATSGIIQTIIGTDNGGYNGDNLAATSTELCTSSLVHYTSDNLYIADGCNHRIRKVTKSTGIVSTIVGTGNRGYSGDNGAATSADLCFPGAVAPDYLTGIDTLEIIKYFGSLIISY